MSSAHTRPPHGCLASLPSRRGGAAREMKGGDFRGAMAAQTIQNGNPPPCRPNSGDASDEAGVLHPRVCLHRENVCGTY